MHKPPNLSAWADALFTMTTIATHRFAPSSVATLALALGAVTLSLAPLASAHADNFNPVVGGGIGAITGAIIGQSFGGNHGAVIGAALGGAAGVTLASEGSHPRYVQPTYVQPVYVQPAYVQPVYVQPVYVQPRPAYVVTQPYYGYRPEHYLREVRFEGHDGPRHGWGGNERGSWGDQRFGGRDGDHRHD